MSTELNSSLLSNIFISWFSSRRLVDVLICGNSILFWFDPSPDLRLCIRLSMTWIFYDGYCTSEKNVVPRFGVQGCCPERLTSVGMTWFDNMPVSNTLAAMVIFVYCCGKGPFFISIHFDYTIKSCTSF